MPSPLSAESTSKGYEKTSYFSFLSSRSRVRKSESREGKSSHEAHGAASSASHNAGETSGSGNSSDSNQGANDGTTTATGKRSASHGASRHDENEGTPWAAVENGGITHGNADAYSGFARSGSVNGSALQPSSLADEALWGPAFRQRPSCGAGAHNPLIDDLLKDIGSFDGANTSLGGRGGSERAGRLEALPTADAGSSDRDSQNDSQDLLDNCYFSHAADPPALGEGSNCVWSGNKASGTGNSGVYSRSARNDYDNSFAASPTYSKTPSHAVPVGEGGGGTPFGLAVNTINRASQSFVHTLKMHDLGCFLQMGSSAPDSRAVSPQGEAPLPLHSSGDNNSSNTTFQKERKVREVLQGKSPQEVQSLVMDLLDVLEEVNSSRRRLKLLAAASPELAGPLLPDLASRFDGSISENDMLGMSMVSTMSTASLARPPVNETYKIKLQYDPLEKKKMINNYLILENLGKGSYGKVKLAEDLSTKRKVAVKIINKRHLQKRFGGVSTDGDEEGGSANRVGDNGTDGARKTNHGKGTNAVTAEEDALKREIAIMKKIRHRSCVSLYEVIDDPSSQKLYLIMDYIPNGPVVKLKQSSIPLELIKAVESNSRVNNVVYNQYLFRCCVRQQLAAAAAHSSSYRKRTVLPPPVASADKDSLVEIDGESPLTQREVYGEKDKRRQSLATPSRGDCVAESDFFFFSCKPVKERVVCVFLRQLVSGLRYLHRKKVVHHDIKPDNILLGINNRVFLTDFGVSEIFERGKAPFPPSSAAAAAAASAAAAAAAEDDDNASGREALKAPRFGAGTLLFTAPELFSDNPEALYCVNPFATDVWALGVTIYCVLMGISPFNGRNYQEISHSIKHVRFPFRGFNIENDPVCAEWETVFSGLLEKDPEKRWSLSKLRSFLDTEPRLKAMNANGAACAVSSGGSSYNGVRDPLSSVNGSPPVAPKFKSRSSHKNDNCGSDDDGDGANCNTPTSFSATQNAAVSFVERKDDRARKPTAVGGGGDTASNATKGPQADGNAPHAALAGAPDNDSSAGSLSGSLHLQPAGGERLYGQTAAECVLDLSQREIEDATYRGAVEVLTIFQKKRVLSEVSRSVIHDYVSKVRFRLSQRRRGSVMLVPAEDGGRARRAPGASFAGGTGANTPEASGKLSARSSANARRPPVPSDCSSEEEEKKKCGGAGDVHDHKAAAPSASVVSVPLHRPEMSHNEVYLPVTIMTSNASFNPSFVSHSGACCSPGSISDFSVLAATRQAPPLRSQNSSADAAHHGNHKGGRGSNHENNTSAELSVPTLTSGNARQALMTHLAHVSHADSVSSGLPYDFHDAGARAVNEMRHMDMRALDAILSVVDLQSNMAPSNSFSFSSSISISRGPNTVDKDESEASHSHKKPSTELSPALTDVQWFTNAAAATRLGVANGDPASSHSCSGSTRVSSPLPTACGAGCAAAAMLRGEPSHNAGGSDSKRASDTLVVGAGGSGTRESGPPCSELVTVDTKPHCETESSGTAARGPHSLYRSSCTPPPDSHSNTDSSWIESRESRGSNDYGSRLPHERTDRGSSDESGGGGSNSTAASPCSPTGAPPALASKKGSLYSMKKLFSSFAIRGKALLSTREPMSARPGIVQRTEGRGGTHRSGDRHVPPASQNILTGFAARGKGSGYKATNASSLCRGARMDDDESLFALESIAEEEDGDDAEGNNDDLSSDARKRSTSCRGAGRSPSPRLAQTEHQGLRGAYLPSHFTGSCRENNGSRSSRGRHSEKECSALSTSQGSCSNEAQDRVEEVQRLSTVGLRPGSARKAGRPGPSFVANLEGPAEGNPDAGSVEGKGEGERAKEQCGSCCGSVKASRPQDSHGPSGERPTSASAAQQCVLSESHGNPFRCGNQSLSEGLFPAGVPSDKGAAKTARSFFLPKASTANNGGASAMRPERLSVPPLPSRMPTLPLDEVDAVLVISPSGSRPPLSSHEQGAPSPSLKGEGKPQSRPLPPVLHGWEMEALGKRTASAMRCKKA